MENLKVKKIKKEPALLLADHVEPATLKNTCSEMYDRFNNMPDLIAIPVVEDFRPIGLLKRIDFLIHLASRYGRPLYGNQSVSVLMDKSPLVVESIMAIDELNKQLMFENQSAIQEGFIVVQNGLYVGIGTAFNIIQANVKKVEKQLEDVKKAKQEAEAASEIKTRFLANMSHELRTPLNAIIGFSELILQQDEGNLPFEKLMNYMGDICDSGHHLLEVINSILDMSKIESGVYELNETCEDPAFIADQAIRIITAQASQKKIKIIKSYPEYCNDIIVDVQVFRQILLNLLSNAVKFSSENTTILLKIVQEKDGAITFIVQDQGKGIEKSKIKEMMKPFTQIECVFSRENEGTGLGLPLVVAFVEAHGGIFDLESENGKGTIARIHLPKSRTDIKSELNYYSA